MCKQEHTQKLKNVDIYSDCTVLHYTPSNEFPVLHCSLNLRHLYLCVCVVSVLKTIWNCVSAFTGLCHALKSTLTFPMHSLLVNHQLITTIMTCTSTMAVFGYPPYCLALSVHCAICSNNMVSRNWCHGFRACVLTVRRMHTVWSPYNNHIHSTHTNYTNESYVQHTDKLQHFTQPEKQNEQH